jgi:hypothetical protein
MSRSPGRGILLIEDTLKIEEPLMFDSILLVPSQPGMEVEFPGWLSPAIGPAAISTVRSSDEDEDEDLEDEDEEEESEQEEDDDEDDDDLDDDDDDDDEDDDDLEDEEEEGV